MINRLVVVIFFICFSSNIKAQLEVSSISDIDNSLENLIVSELIGCNIEVSNIEYTGNTQAIGEFSYTDNNMYCSEGDFGLDRGILMTTGMIDYAVGPNNDDDNGQEWNVEYEDDFFHNYLVDFDLISESISLFDACVLEFDIFSSDSVSLEFEVIFGSEEYTEWMNPFYADAFAFFVTEIDGDLDENFDLIPQNIMETGDVLNILDTVNNQFICEIENKPISAWTIRPYSYGFSLPGLNECLYLDNENGAFCNAIGYDGYTVPMLFNLSLVPNANYHIKMVIIDGVSSSWAGLDSGIFIKSNNLLEEINVDDISSFFEYDISCDTVFFNNISSLSMNTNCFWDFDGDGIVDSNELNPMHIYEAPGNYTVSLDLVNDCTGIISTTYEIIIDDMTNLNDLSKTSIFLFPNPATTSLHVNINNLDLESVIEVFDLSGRCLYKEVLCDSSTLINTSEFLPGMYYVSVSNKFEKSSYIEKLIIL